MGTEIIAKKIDLVVMTGSVPFITAGVFQGDDSDATLLSGALTGMSNMFQELLKQGELRHSELYNAHVYIRHLTQMNDILGLIGPEIKHGAQMRVAIIVREGELSREQELALSELCYSIMVIICQRSHLAKKLIKGNIEGYIPSYQETIQILADAINDYRKRSKKSLFYENTNFIQEKDKFTILTFNDSLLEYQIREFSQWIEQQYYPDYFPTFDFINFFGKKEYWNYVQVIKEKFTNDLKTLEFKNQVSASLFNYILKAGLMPLILYSDDIIKRIEIFYENELPKVFENFVCNLLPIRGPSGISLRSISQNISQLKHGNEKLIGWQFVKYFLLELGDHPFEQTYLKQFVKLLIDFDLAKEFLSAIIDIKSTIVPKSYLNQFVNIINTALSKPLNLDDLKSQKEILSPKKSSKGKANTAPSIPTYMKSPIEDKEVITTENQEIKKININLPSATPESNITKNQSLIRAISRIYSWIHDYLYGNISIDKKNLPVISNDGMFFYNISESLTIEMGLIFDIIQAFSSPRTWLIGQLSRIIDDIEAKLKIFDPDSNIEYTPERKLTIDVEHVNEQFRKTSERIINIVTQIETDAVEGRITSENKKAYLVSGFLGRIQDISVPYTRKLIDELKNANKNLSEKELDLISEATSVNFKGLTTNITSMQLLTVPLPQKDSEYSKEVRDIFTNFRKWNLDFDQVIDTVFRLGLEITDIENLPIHENIITRFLRSGVNDEINKRLESLPNSDIERYQFMKSCYYFKDELYNLIGDRLLLNKPLRLFTTIHLSKPDDEKNYLSSFSPIQPPIISEEISKFFIISEEEKPVIIGRVYSYLTFENQQINSLTELIISDAFRRAYQTIEPGLITINKMGKKIHGGISNLQYLLLQTYNQICSQLSFTKITN
ncbi:MAG TPA: hypothetical protein VMZ29_08855 [Candidatus Bathyarchaeia archaeon]|nr:hypothetical protein [Candidatus Bathyarchaeia archaeon]